MPGEAVKDAAGIGPAVFVVHAVVPLRRLPDGHVNCHALQVLADGEIVIAGDEPFGIPVVDAASVDVQVLETFPDGDLAVLKLEIEVILPQGPGHQAALLILGGVGGVGIGIDLSLLPLSALDVVEDVLVRLIGRVRFLLRFLLRLRRENGIQRSLVHHRGFRNLAKAPPGPNGLLLHHRAVVTAVPVVHSIVEVHRSPGSDGQKLPEIVGNLAPEGVRLLPVPLPSGGGVPLPGDPVSQSPQGGEGQRHSQEEGQKTGQRLDQPAGAEDLHALPRLHGLPDLLRHKLLQGPAGVLIRAVPFCIQCPTPP